MGTVFISYRRGETDGQARALNNELAASLGKDCVFMDVDSIGLGRDFRKALRECLASCDLMLALIGRDWVDAKDRLGRRRLEDPNDLVRLEIASALKRNIPVTPVLLQGAGMPLAEQLPDDLKDLAFRNGFELSHNRWESDVQEMMKRLGLSVDPRRSSPATEPSPVARVGAVASPVSPPKTFRLLWSAIVIAVILVAGDVLLVRERFAQEAAEDAHRVQIALEQVKAERETEKALAAETDNARALAEAERVKAAAAADRAAPEKVAERKTNSHQRARPPIVGTSKSPSSIEEARAASGSSEEASAASGFDAQDQARRLLLGQPVASGGRARSGS